MTETMALGPLLAPWPGGSASKNQRRRRWRSERVEKGPAQDDAFTTGQLVRPVRTVRVGVTLLLLGNALVVTTAELVGGADGWGGGQQHSSV